LAALEAEDAAEDNELAAELADVTAARADETALVADDSMEATALVWAEAMAVSSTRIKYRYRAAIVSNQGLEMP